MNKYSYIEIVEKNEEALNVIEGLINECVSIIEQNENVKEGITLMHLMQEFIWLTKVQNNERHYMEMLSNNTKEEVALTSLTQKVIQLIKAQDNKLISNNVIESMKLMSEHIKCVEEETEQVNTLYTKVLALRGSL